MFYAHVAVCIWIRCLVRAREALGLDLELLIRVLSLWMLRILLAPAAYQQIPARGYRDLLIYRQSCSRLAPSDSTG